MGVDFLFVHDPCTHLQCTSVGWLGARSHLCLYLISCHYVVLDHWRLRDGRCDSPEIYDAESLLDPIECCLANAIARGLCGNGWYSHVTRITIVLNLMYHVYVYVLRYTVTDKGP